MNDRAGKTRPSADSIRAAVSAALAQRSEQRRTTLAPDPRALPLADAADRLLGQGKRLRPAFAIATWLACGGQHEGPRAEAMVRLGASLELFQAAALVHDDLIDASPQRRGMPSAHRYFAQRHRDSQLAGSPESHGTAGAILLGDLLLLESADELAAALGPFERDVAREAHGAFQAMCREVTIGQYLDVSAEAHDFGEPAADLAQARRVVHAKSASYSVLGPVRLGAILAAAPPQLRGPLEQFGAAAGEAFQLRDDLLGVFGRPELTGKPAGDDLREGKRTVLVALARAGLGAADDARLRSQLGRRDLDDADIEELRELLSRSGAVAACEELIAALHAEALAAVGRCDLREPGRDLLLSLTEAALHRDG